ncbi:MAG TPA: dihydrolipoamide acetyltransferase family protein [Anaerolineae bacterium]|nr:dihydrolipoamide acetyltransferase family protein [Anaerolineae bacterium]
MSTNVTMPSMGFDMTEGQVARWLKNVGDTVTRGETIGEIETEKATVDLSAPVDGVFAQILVQPGQTVAVNTPIAVIAAPGENAPSQPTTPTTQAPVPQASAFQAPAAQPPTAPDEKEMEAAPATATITPDEETGTPTAQAPSSEAAADSDGDGRIKASPLARNMAKAEGIELASIKGTGPGGRILERDVQQMIAARKTAAPTAPKPTPTAAPAPTPKPAPAPTPTPQPTPAPAAVPAMTQAQEMKSGEQALSRMRQTIARRLLESKTTIPHYYLTMEIFMGEAMKLREQLNAMAANDAEKLSVNDVIIAAVARTLRKFPNINGYFKGDKIEYHNQINVGVAVSVEDGLLTPVLHNADQKSLKQIATETKEMVARARANKMKPEDLGPGTFTVSNLGMYGIEEFAAIINPPESAILAVGAVKKLPVVMDDSVQIAQVMKVTLSADHRIVDGAMGARFLQELKKLLENPVNLLVS